MIASCQESDDKPRPCAEKQRHYSADEGRYSQHYDLPSGHIQLWELDHKGSRMPKNWYLQTEVLEKTPEIALDSKEFKPSIVREINPEYSLEALILKLQVFWSPDVNRWLIGKVHNAGKDWLQKGTEASEDEMTGYHNQCNEHEPGRTLGDGEGQGGLTCCHPWGGKESDLTGWLNNWEIQRMISRHTFICCCTDTNFYLICATI